MERIRYEDLILEGKETISPSLDGVEFTFFVKDKKGMGIFKEKCNISGTQIAKEYGNNQEAIKKAKKITLKKAKERIDQKNFKNMVEYITTCSDFGCNEVQKPIEFF